MADQQRGSRNHKECYNCGKFGHFSRDCHSKKYEQAEMGIEDEEDEDHMIFSASEESEKTKDEDVWLVDSGCT